MSNWREQFGDESAFRATAVVLGRYYHYVVLVFLVGFTFWNRTSNWGNFVVGGQVLFRGNDPWYHYRSTQYVVEHFPSTMPFEPWTYFPVGTSSAQFGTIFDQTMAAVALLLGLGSPSEELVKLVVLFAPAVVGTLVAVPTYVISRRIGGRFAGVVGVAVMAFAADRLLTLGVVGFSDHQVAEALTQAVAVLGVMVAIRVAETDKPVWELLADREFDALRRPLGWAVLAGVAISVYLSVWPPGVFLLGILGVFFVVHLSFETLRGRSPEHAAFAGAVALGTAGVLQFASVRTLDISATARSLLQPGLALAVAAGCVFMAWLGREWDDRQITPVAYPVAVVGLLVAGAAAMALVLPDLFGYFVDQVLRVVGFQTSPTAGTVGEAQPASIGRIYNNYQFAAVTAVAGGLVLLAKQYVDDDPRGEHLLVVVWFLFMVAATLTQGRFAYYLTVPVAALNAAFVGLVMRVVGSTEDTVEIETYQVLAVVAVLLVVVAPMLVVGAGPVRTASGAQNPGGIVGWQGSLNWMAEETPLEGQYANASGEPMAYYGTYSRTDDFDYPGGAYGVMSWWDYGHWITAVGERIPNANPFQQGSGDAARYLLSQNESASLSVLDSIDEEDAGTRFVMVDWKMVQTESLSPVRGKFFAPPAFADGVDRSTFFSRVLATGNLQQSGLYRSTLAMRHKQAYYDSTVVRLYRYHGSSVQPQPYVLDWQGQERPLGNGETFVRPPQQGSPVKFFDNMSAARAYVQADGSSQVGGIGPYPSERVPAMDHYRLVHMGNVSALQGGETNAFRRDLQQSGVAGEIQSQLGPNATRSDLQRRAVNLLYQNSPAWTKTFERVEGATVEGTGPENASLRLSVQMLPENGAAFNYVKRVETGPDGEFSTTVPYSTTGYDAVGPADGYTNTSVRATGPYTISSGLQANESGALLRWSGTVNVTERQVVGADDSPAVVDVEKQVLSAPPDDNGTAQNGTDGANATVDGADGQPDDGTGDATDDANASSGTGDGASQSLTGAGVAAPDPTVVRP